MRQSFGNLYIDSFENLDQIKAGMHIITANLDHLVEKNPLAKQAFASADLIFPDGIALLLLAKLAGLKDISKIPGIELAEKLLEKCQRVAFLGSEEKVVIKLREKFKAKLVYAHHGYFDSSQEEKILEDILKTSPELLLVALGCPKQEIFIYKHKDRLQSLISIGIGGSFDIWSGKVTRAPLWIRNFHLEWLFRIFQEPSRIFRFLYNLYALSFLLLSNLFDECYKRE